MSDKESNDKLIRESANVIDIENAQEERRKKREKALSKKRVADQNRENPDKRRRKRKIKLSKRRFIVSIIVLVLIAFLGVTAFRIISLKAEQKKVEEYKENKLEEKAKLEDELTRINDPEYIEQQARERLRMIREGEILYIFPEAEEDNTQ